MEEFMSKTMAEVLFEDAKKVADHLRSVGRDIKEDLGPSSRTTVKTAPKGAGTGFRPKVTLSRVSSVTARPTARSNMVLRQTKPTPRARSRGAPLRTPRPRPVRASAKDQVPVFSLDDDEVIQRGTFREFLMSLAGVFAAFVVILFVFSPYLNPALWEFLLNPGSFRHPVGLPEDLENPWTSDTVYRITARLSWVILCVSLANLAAAGVTIWFYGWKMALAAFLSLLALGVAVSGVLLAVSPRTLEDLLLWWL